LFTSHRNSLPLVKKPQVFELMNKSRLRSSIAANGGTGESVTAGDMPLCSFLASSAVEVATTGCHCVFSDRAHAPRRANAATATRVLLRTIVDSLVTVNHQLGPQSLPLPYRLKHIGHQRRQHRIAKKITVQEGSELGDRGGEGGFWLFWGLRSPNLLVLRLAGRLQQSGSAAEPRTSKCGLA
jgi:hypothetical protein